MHLTRAELKSRAKTVLKTQYWQIFAVLMIYEILPTLILPSMNFMFNIGNFLPVVAVVTVFGVMILSLLVSIFLISPLYMAICRFILKSTTEAGARFSVIWEVLKENYFSLVKAGFMRDIFLLLWSLPYLAIASIMAVIIPFTAGNPVVVAGFAIGMIFAIILLLYKSYSYSMVNYIMAESPEADWRNALQKSKNLMRGKTFFAFKLGLSFIGWLILGSLACGIGVYFIQPYIAATQAQFYLALQD